MHRVPEVEVVGKVKEDGDTLLISGEAEGVWQPLQDTLASASLGALALSYVALVAVMSVNYRVPRWDLMIGPILLGVGAAFGLICRSSYRFRATLFILAMLAAVVAVNRTSTLRETRILYSFVCLAAGVLLGPWMATLVALVSAAALLSPAHTSPAAGESVWHLLFLCLTTTAVWAIMRPLFATLRRLEGSEALAWHYARQANERRGELARAKKALSDMYDLLQRTNHELAIARAELEKAYRAKAQFAANVSHELRTPLNLILGFTEMMCHSPEVYGDMRWPPALRADIYEIYQATRHLLEMIDDILDLSRIESQKLSLRLELVDISEIIDEAIATIGGLLRSKRTALEIEVERGLPKLLVDRPRIRQVLLNLLQNAIRVTQAGQIKVSAWAEDGEVVVSVADTGPGIDPEELDTIFEEFRQAKGAVGGTGLGLAICRQLVHLHGGRIEVDSQVGKGSVFRFYLPVPGSGRARSRLTYYSPEGWNPPVPENPLGKSVVVMATEQTRAAALARYIRGYRAIVTSSCDGLAELVSVEHPAGIVVVSAPSSPAPATKAEILRAAGREDLPVISCEIPAEAIETMVCRELGVAGYLRKPVGRQELARAIKLVCSNPRRFLVVDDDPGFVSFVERVLRADFEQAQVSRAYSGKEALAKLAENIVDVVLLDLVMPELSGLDVLAHLKRNSSSTAVPVIAVSGYDLPERLLEQWPTCVTLYRVDGYSEARLGAYISSLLEVAPPDYSAAAPPSTHATAVA